MKNKINTTFITGATIGALVLASALPVFAEDAVVNTSANVGITGPGVRAGIRANASTTVSDARITRAKERADQEITRRVTALNNLTTRLQGMKRLSDGQKTSISATVQSQITVLATLKTKIDADADTAVLKTDVQSITKSYRIFALILPQVEILSAADRAFTVTDTLADLSTKLQTRITEAQTAGKDVSALVSIKADMDAKIADAKIQAQAAIDGTASLTPDNGDQTKLQSNTQALKDARAKLKTVQQDFETARKDAGSIVKALKGMNLTVTATSTASTTQ